MIPLPSQPTDVLRLADWMELSALIAPDGDSSRDDLDSALRLAAIYPPHTEDDEITALALAVFNELESRKKAAVDGYPFEIILPYIKLKKDWKRAPAYVFCLCLSYYGDPDNPKRKTFPRRLFEHISRDAVLCYLGGDAVRFASPRHATEIPSNFAKAITKVCDSCIREGGGFKKGGLADQKDCHVDIIAWKHFPDRAVGKIVLFGNCATGKNWSGTKLTELMVEPFCDEWLLDPPVSSIVRSFFMPHRCESDTFIAYSRRAGIIFDRCRIAFWCHNFHQKRSGEPGSFYTDLDGIRDWTLRRLKSIRT